MLGQMRQSGGMWFELDGTKILHDPGPGCLVRCKQYRLSPRTLDAIILSHRHIDHSNDVNIMTEAMTGGGFQPKGLLIAPSQCLDEDPVVLKYVREFVEIIPSHVGLSLNINDVKVSFPLKLHHTVETYGTILEFQNRKVGYIPDTEYFEELSRPYRNVDILILNVVRITRNPRISHLNIDDVMSIVSEARPKRAVLTHFGMQVLKASPEYQAKRITENTGIDTIAASDGMKLPLDSKGSLFI